jgi:hypothetical protein
VKTAAERVAGFLREHGNGMYEPDGPFAQALVVEMRTALTEQRKLCSESVNDLYRTHRDANGHTLYIAYSAVLDAPLIGEKGR